jgi:hypothetical protein
MHKEQEKGLNGSGVQDISATWSTNNIKVELSYKEYCRNMYNNTSRACQLLGEWGLFYGPVHSWTIWHQMLG